MNVPSDIAVIRARLPYVDRRALSEAWYSAMHLSARGEHLRMRVRAQSVSARGAALPYSRRAAAACPVEQPARERLSVRQGVRASASRSPVQPQVVQKLGVSKTSRRPLCGDARASVRAASFTVALGDARVRIIARSDGERMHLTAVCSARHAEVVRRALAQASLELRSCGAVVAATVRCEGETE